MSQDSSSPLPSLVTQCRDDASPRSVWTDILTPAAQAALLASATLAGAGVATAPQAAQAQISFDSGTALSADFDLSESSVGDFDGDDDLDLLMSGRVPGSAERKSLVFENTGDNAGSGSIDGNTFQDASAGLTGVSSSMTAVGDFDGDGDLDLVVAGTEGSSYYGGAGPNITIYENTDQNSGTLDGNTFSPVGAGLTDVFNGSISVADFDGDNDLDLLVTGTDGSGETATIYENTDQNSGTLDGNTFSPVGAGLTGVQEGSSSVGDYDGDDDLDLLITGYDGSEATAKIYENTAQNDGSGSLDGQTFSPISAGLSGVRSTAGSTVSDLDGDGDLDLVVAGDENGIIADGGLSTTVYENTDQNSGTLDSGTFQAVGAGLQKVRAASIASDDLDGDDDNEIVLIGQVDDNNRYTIIYENTDQNSGALDGNTFQEAGEALQVLSYGSISIGDLDGDFDLDLLITGSYDDSNGITTQTATVYDNTSDNPIPVELTEFAAQRDGQAALLSWQTASEQNNTGFEVQRLVGEAGTYESMGFVDGAGTTSKPQSYRFRTDDLRVGTHRFRLKQVDADGSIEYSDPVALDITIAESYRLTAPAPNPVTEGTQIRLAVEQAQAVTVGVYDLMGREVATVLDRTLPAQSEQSIRVDTEGLPTGTYFLRVDGERFTATERITVVK